MQYASLAYGLASYELVKVTLTRTGRPCPSFVLHTFITRYCNGIKSAQIIFSISLFEKSERIEVKVLAELDGKQEFLSNIALISL